MNPNKIECITCVNDEEKYEKCLACLKKLQVPEGMELSFRPVRGAKSMVDGYEQARKASDAKYKLYLHQDLFITEETFLLKLLETFQSDDAIGIIGVVGSEDIPQNGLWMKSGRLLGMIYDDCLTPGTLKKSQARTEAYPMEAMALDGCILATQHDVPWRTDVLTAWDYYDVSICLEHIRHGYRVVVLPQEEPCVTHWCGSLNLTHFTEERVRFMAEYGGDRWRPDDGTLSIVIPVRNSMGSLPICIGTMEDALQEIDHEYIVVDDGSTDGTAEWLVKNAIRSIRHKEPRGLVASFNEGAALLPAACTLYLQPNTLLTFQVFSRLLAALSTDRACLVGGISNADPIPGYSKLPYTDYKSFLAFAKDWASSEAVSHAKEEELLLHSPAVLFNKQGLAPLDEGYGDALSWALWDACLKTHRAGGAVLKAGDAFLHENETLPPPMEAAEKHFYDIYGFRLEYSCHACEEMLALLDKTKAPERFLVVGCAAGADFPMLRNLYPDGDFYGIEIDPHSAEVASCFAQVITGDLETLERPEWQDSFDVVLMGDVLEHLKDPWAALQKINAMMRSGGQIIISVPNITHISIFSEMLHGGWDYAPAGILDRTHLRFFTKKTACELLARGGFSQRRLDGILVRLPPEMLALKDRLLALPETALEERELLAYQWLLAGEKP